MARASTQFIENPFELRFNSVAINLYCRKLFQNGNQRLCVSLFLYCCVSASTVENLNVFRFPSGNISVAEQRYKSEAVRKRRV